MYRKLLVPLDGSTFGEHALPLALSIARRAQATVELVHVHVPVVYVDHMVSFDDALDRDTRVREQAYLDAVVQRLATVSRIPVSAVLLTGPIAETLQEHALAQGADLIVMTTHGRGPLSRFWLGSVADELVRRAPIPVLLVRPQEATPNFAQEPACRNVLIPLDGSELAEQIIEPAVDLAAVLGATDYTLLRVVRPVPVLGSDLTGYATGALDLGVMEEQEAKAQKYLDTVAERFRANALRVQTRVVVHEQPAVAILAQPRDNAVDLIALETHGRRGIARLLLGSVVDKVLRGACIPVLVHRPHAK